MYAKTDTGYSYVRACKKLQTVSVIQVNYFVIDFFNVLIEGKGGERQQMLQLKSTLSVGRSLYSGLCIQQKPQ